VLSLPSPAVAAANRTLHGGDPPAERDWTGADGGRDAATVEACSTDGVS
jgi:hypothetical protein